jgi:hypothetical protein
MDVADEARRAALALEDDLAAVERLELGPVADADDGRVLELVGEQGHELVLALGIERGGRFVEDDDVGPMQQEPSEGEALPLSARQRLVPRRFLVDPLDEVFESDLAQRLRDVLRAPVLRRSRVGNGAAQRPLRHIGPLRQQKELCAGFDLDAPVAPRP